MISNFDPGSSPVETPQPIIPVLHAMVIDPDTHLTTAKLGRLAAIISEYYRQMAHHADPEDLLFQMTCSVHAGFVLGLVASLPTEQLHTVAEMAGIDLETFQAPFACPVIKSLLVFL